MARAKGEAGMYPFQLARHVSPLKRETGPVDARLQRGKERNVALAAGKLDSIVIKPGQIFSYHHVVGRPSRLRGFRPGLELHGGEMQSGVGGGCCQISNMLYLLALRAGLEITERHRHALDLFPDHGRTVPFGCGATVFYTASDLRIKNTLDQPVILRFEIADGQLSGEIYAGLDPGWKAEIYEIDHRYYKDGDAWHRENRVRRRLCAADGSVVRDEEISHNVGRCLYDPETVP